MRKGFTLVEIMIVVAIIVLLASIAIPNLLRAKANANQSAAASAIHTLSASAQSFRAVNTAYPSTLFSLSNATPPYIDSTLGGGAKQGYSFTITGATNTFSSVAVPSTTGVTGMKAFYVNENGVIRWTDATSSITLSSDGSAWPLME